MKKVVGLVLGLALAMLPAAWAAQSTGNIYGKVIDESGAVMPGANVTLSGPTVGKISTVTGSQGDFHFLNLDPNNNYKVTVALAGFTTVVREVIVNSGQNVEVSFGLKVATKEEVVTVTAETPVVDTKKVGTSTTLTKEELSDIPNARDPWALLRTIPGVVVDRVNIAGNESGQQAGFQGKGSNPNDTMWTMDGVVITDMAAVGSSPTYYDYDAFDEVNISTGGNDLRAATGGIGLNFVTKRGTNNFHGNVHGYLTNHKLESHNVAGTSLVGDPRLQGGDFANHIDQVADYGGDLGGPIIKDKLWFWGSYGRQDIRNQNLNQTFDKTILVDYSGKLNWQASTSDMISVFYFKGAKNKYGRNPGFASNNPQSFLWNQANAYSGGPPGLIKGEWNHIFSSSFTLNAKYAYYNAGFGFTPGGGTAQDAGVDTFTDTSFGSAYTYQSVRPEHVANLDGNYFFAGMGGNNELKFGFGYRKTPVTSSSAWPGDGLVGYGFGVNAAGQETGIARITRNGVKTVLTQYMDGYIGDTFTKDRLTLNVGVRYDHQWGSNSPSSAPASIAFPSLLPALDYPGTGTTITWNDVSPRAGITYALDESRKTVVRASYARYAGQLPNGDAGYSNPLSGYSFLGYNWVDLNHDGIAQPNEILFNQGLQYAYNVNPNNPGVASASSKQISSSYTAEHASEVIVGLDREVIPDLAVSAVYTWKRANDVATWEPRIGLTSANYTQGNPVTKGGYTVVGFAPDPSLVAASANGRILENRPDYYAQYSGVELTLMKRLSHNWMARVAFGYMDWNENFTGPNSVQNPTRSDISSYSSNANALAGPQVNGGIIAPRSGGSGKGDVFYGPKWQMNANALYQLPSGFEVAASLFARQGFPEPPYISVNLGGDGTQRVVATSALDTVRNDNLYDLDLRLAKNFHLGGTGNASILVDAFNIFNTNTTLQFNRNLASSTYQHINDIVNPRIIRFGLRLGF